MVNTCIISIHPRAHPQINEEKHNCNIDRLGPFKMGENGIIVVISIGIAFKTICRMISGTALASFSLIIDPVDGWQIIIVIKRIESKNFVEI